MVDAVPRMATSNEPKQQGALEVPRSQSSSVSAEEAQRKLVEEARQAGVTAFQFDPNASVEQKKQMAREVCFHYRLSVLDSEILTSPCRQSLRAFTIGQRAWLL